VLNKTGSGSLLGISSALGALGAACAPYDGAQWIVSHHCNKEKPSVSTPIQRSLAFSLYILS
jgi:hypothetical protein